MVVPVDSIRPQLQVCIQMRYAPNPLSCANSGSNMILSALEKEVILNKLDIEVVATRCMLKCDDGPNIKLIPAGIQWNYASLKTVPEIIATCQKILETS